ncbi:MAG: hypothetical protein J6T30_05905 [Bacteroidales bacterium]|nr:hypothetical protein [Bacteroidales bacterium]
MHNIRLLPFLITLLTFSLTSCKPDKYDPIPNTAIRFTIDINDMEFNALQSLGGSVVITSATNNFGSRAAGFNHNGILVYRSLIDEFMAFDRTCPHCYATDKFSYIIITEDNASITAKCPHCETEYFLEYNGQPLESGPGKYYLKNYKTTLSNGRYLTVYNNAK